MSFAAICAGVGQHVLVLDARELPQPRRELRGDLRPARGRHAVELGAQVALHALLDEVRAGVGSEIRLDRLVGERALELVRALLGVGPLVEVFVGHLVATGGGGGERGEQQEAREHGGSLSR